MSHILSVIQSLYFKQRVQTVFTGPQYNQRSCFLSLALNFVIKWQVVGKYFFLVSGYLEMGSDVFSGGQDFEISMDFRTDQLNALLLFTYNTQTEDYMLVRNTDTFEMIITEYWQYYT